jgi:predicted negative regulator of RcsB-dependent stress response
LRPPQQTGASDVDALLTQRELRGEVMDGKSVIIGALIIAVAVIGYLYWDKQRNTVEIKLPSVTIQKN